MVFMVGFHCFLQTHYLVHAFFVQHDYCPLRIKKNTLLTDAVYIGFKKIYQ